MIEFILSTLAEFGLIREDFKHHRKITKKEKEDEIKKPFQRYFLQPSTIFEISILIIATISTFLFFSYQRRFVYPDKTQKEITEISYRMKNWYENLGHYPAALDVLVGNSPVRQGWIKDAWNREYQFIIIENGNGFLIPPAGCDGEFGTEDDIKSE